MGRKSRSARGASKATDNGIRTPAADPEGSEGPATPVVGTRAALSRELADFLVEFSIVLHTRSMYPPEHPQLLAAANRFVRRLDALLERRESVTLGVARETLVIETVSTNPDNALLRDLARRLHRHRIASVRFTLGATLEEIDGLLGALSADPQRGAGPFGDRLEVAHAWSHIQLQPCAYDKLALHSTEPDQPSDDGPGSRDFWTELALAALARDGAAASAGDPEALVVRQPIERDTGEVPYDRVVLDYLSQIAEESSGRAGAGQDRLRQRVSRLIDSLDAQTLRRLLEAGADQPELRKVPLNSSQILAVDAVVEVLESAAEASQPSISHNLLRLLHKLAQNTRASAAPTPIEAHGELRKNVARLLGDWRLDDPNPGDYTAILEGMVRLAPSEPPEAVPQHFDAEIMLKMSLELGCVGPSVTTAVDAMLAQGLFVRVAELLDSAAPSGALEALWRQVATVDRLRAELGNDPSGNPAVPVLVSRLGPAAAEPLLDLLESAGDRSTRAMALKHLRSLGPEATAPAAARLPDAPWYLQRNILQLLGQWAEWPPGFSPRPYATHRDVRVRREGMKLLLASSSHRVEAIVAGLRDRDERIMGLALNAALDGCPPTAGPLVRDIAVAENRPSELRSLAVRVLARSRASEALPILLLLALRRRRWFGHRLAPKSPEMLAVIAGLARYWQGDARASGVLSKASSHSDPEIRAAALVDSA